jgi:hypothetical protein
VLAAQMRRSIVVTVRASLALACALMLFSTVATAQHGYQLKPVPSGLVANIKNDPAEPLDPKPFLNRYMSGVTLQIHWSDIEPVEGQPNWARLDELFAAAELSHKWVHLYIFPGFFEPTWALQGAETDQFIAPYGPYQGRLMTLPMPWDPVYLGNWFAFVRRLSDRYGDRPEFLMVACAGPTSVSEEFTEPDNLKGKHSAIKTWIKHGYTSTKTFLPGNSPSRPMLRSFRLNMFLFYMGTA